MIGGHYRVTFEGFELGERETAALSEAGFTVESYRTGAREGDPGAISSGRYFAAVRGRADDPMSAADAVRAALGGEESPFSNFRAERMISLGRGGDLRPDRRAQ